MNRRLPIVIVMIASLIVSGVTRRWSAVAHTREGSGSVASSGAGLGQMNSYALALLLGGLRGPLVMVLWPSAELQKTERNLEDFDTKIEWIRMLQAEFDTVHVYQIWNKAYNISVQMANMSNKYATILDAMEYAHRVDAERPNNINILVAIAQLYHEKLGVSTEKDWYRQRVRDESLPRQPMVRITVPAEMRDRLVELTSKFDWPPSSLKFSTDESDDTVSVNLPKTIADKIQGELKDPKVKFVDRAVAVSNSNDPQWKRREMDPMLDANYRILPQYLTVKKPRPADLPAGAQWNDGSELQYLKQFEPYPYGISPMALGYNYDQRAQVLMTENHQKHSSLSSMVISKTPAVTLKMWSEEEWERGRRAEAEALGIEASSERAEFELATANLPLTTAVHFRSRFDEAMFSYDRAAQIIDQSLKEYERHLTNFKGNFELYNQHMDEIRAEKLLVTADRKYLAAMIATGTERAKLAAESASDYHQVIRADQIVFLKDFLPTEAGPKVLPPNINKTNIESADSALLEQMFAKAKALRDAKAPEITGNVEELEEYDAYSTRAKIRLKHLPQ